MRMPLLDAFKERLLEKIAAMTNPRNSALREVVENADPEYLDAEALSKIAADLRKSEIVTQSITGDSEQN
jgi:phosphopantothenate synthetase